MPPAMSCSSLLQHFNASPAAQLAKTYFARMVSISSNIASSAMPACLRFHANPGFRHFTSSLFMTARQTAMQRLRLRSA